MLLCGGTTDWIHLGLPRWGDADPARRVLILGGRERWVATLCCRRDATSFSSGAEWCVHTGRRCKRCTRELIPSVVLRQVDTGAKGLQDQPSHMTSAFFFRVVVDVFPLTPSNFALVVCVTMYGQVSVVQVLAAHWHSEEHDVPSLLRRGLFPTSQRERKCASAQDRRDTTRAFRFTSQLYRMGVVWLCVCAHRCGPLSRRDSALPAVVLPKSTC